MEDVCVFPERIAGRITPEDPEGLFPQDPLKQAAAPLAKASFQPFKEMDLFCSTSCAIKPIKEPFEKRTFGSILCPIKGAVEFAHLFYNS